MLTVQEILPRASLLNSPYRLDRLIKIQGQIARRVRIIQCPKRINKIAGVDVGLKSQSLVACFIVFSFPELKIIDNATATAEEVFPYIPNFLSFRELPVVLKAYKKLKEEPDLILVDGQGIAHPRFCGIASHLGVILHKPTIGCAKSHLIGDFEMPDNKRGSWRPIRLYGRTVGIVLRTKDNVKPIFVSPGNLVDVADCIRYVLATSHYRIPEPLRYAHNFIKRLPIEVSLKRGL